MKGHELKAGAQGRYNAGKGFLVQQVHLPCGLEVTAKSINDDTSAEEECVSIMERSYRQPLCGLVRPGE